MRFAYSHDDGDFAHAALRCVGAGKCRITDPEQVMCPSFQVTHEEKHTTRGRARLLFEMLQGEVIRDGWQSREVYDALDLCLACKGCTNDCPVNVDMPTYKAEFLHHHFKSQRRWRPRYAYAFGLIDQAAALGSPCPGLVNLATHTPPLARLAKLAAGMAPEREIPRFAPLTLQQWFSDRGGSRNAGGPRVVLWPDTFNNHFHTDVGVACVEALEAAGWHVVMPRGHVCCGRPLYDYGFLDLAERYLHRTLDVLRDEIRAGTPVVGMEPSCLAVFKDELTEHAAARRRRRSGWRSAPATSPSSSTSTRSPVPRLERDALLWGHCHHKATGGVEHEQRLLERMGVDVQEVRGGCCGLAGSWGFEKGHHEISMACGEQALLPAVRAAPRRHAGRRRRVLVQDADLAGRNRARRASRGTGDENGSRAWRRRVPRRQAGGAVPRGSAAAAGARTGGAARACRCRARRGRDRLCVPAAGRRVGRERPQTIRREKTVADQDPKQAQLDEHRVGHDGTALTTDQGVRVEHTDDSLSAGERGPTLMEDFHFREKLTRFDHERIPERVVHARGAGAYGYFELHRVAGRRHARGLPRPRPAGETPVFVRFSTVARLARLGRHRRATCAASRRSSTRARATTTSSATTCRSSSSRTGSSSPTSCTR